MAKRKLRKLRLMRPADAFLPLAFLAGAILAGPARAFEVFFNFYAIRLFALASAPGLRVAFATQPTLQRAQGSVLSAILLQTAGAALCDVGWVVYAHFTGSIPSLVAILVGYLLNIEHVFYEYLYAMGDSYSSGMSRAITSILLLTGFLLAREAVLALMAALGMSVTLIIALATLGRMKGAPNAQVFRAAPRALMQAMLYIAPAFALLGLHRTIGRWDDAPQIGVAALFAGWAVYSLCQSPFRRSPLEARKFNPVAILLMLGACAGYFLIDSFAPEGLNAQFGKRVALAVGLAGFAALILFANFRRSDD